MTRNAYEYIYFFSFQFLEIQQGAQHPTEKDESEICCQPNRIRGWSPSYEVKLRVHRE